MNAIFADTFYWIALGDSADSAHRPALALTAERASSQIVTTDEVLTEYLVRGCNSIMSGLTRDIA